jgi:hypothetical protein
MTRLHSLLMIAAGSLLIYASPVSAACETSCSDLVDDDSAFARIQENISALEAETVQIQQWQADPIANMLSIAQAINRKTQYANAVREVLTDYFLYQRLQPSEDVLGSEYQSYAARLGLFHQALNAAVLTKENADPSAIQDLQHKVEAFKNHFLGNADFQLGQQI